MIRPAALGALTLALACGGGDDAAFERYEPDPGTPERVAWEAGITGDLGAWEPTETTVRDAETTYTFDPADGPVCMRGAPFAMGVEERAGDELLIFLQGGGACWSDFCLAVTKAQPRIPDGDLLVERDDNPLRDHDVVYVPYCDGSLFAGDRDVDEDGDGTADRLHHGLANLTAALSQGYRHFPNPSRVVLAGSSGGGFGTLLAASLVRYVYPGVPIDVLDDAGIGIARGAADPEFVGDLIAEFGASDFIPADCSDCTTDGHITGLVDYLLARDPLLRFGAVSSYYDSIISETFLMIDSEAFAADLRSETDALHAAYPDRYRRFLYQGRAHTALLGDVTGIVGSDLTAVELPPNALETLSGVEIASMYELTSDGVALVDWVGAMTHDGDWVDVAPAAEPLE